MGVKGLLKALSDVKRDTHVADLKGLRVGLDAYCFLHRRKCAFVLDLLSGRPSNALFQPLLGAVRLLLQHGAEPVIVFDGGKLPAKDFTESVRQQSRENARRHCCAILQQEGVAALSDGAWLQKAMEVTPLQASQCFFELQALGVGFVVAPYEADAQLAHLSLTGKVDVIVTEDSDLIVHGCPRVWFKFDASGNANEIRLADLHKCRGLQPYLFTPEGLLELSVLAGCDYLGGIPGVGIKKASQMLYLTNGDALRAIELATAKGFKVPVGYHHDYQVARLVFRSQIIFDVSSRRVQPLRPLPHDWKIWNCRSDCILRLGRTLPDDVASAIADGQLHPETFQPLFISHTITEHLQEDVIPEDVTVGSEDIGESSTQMSNVACTEACSNACHLTKDNAQLEEEKWLSQLTDVFGKRLAEVLACAIAQKYSKQSCDSSECLQTCFKKDPIEHMPSTWLQRIEEQRCLNSSTDLPSSYSLEVNKISEGCGFDSKPFRPPRPIAKTVVGDACALWSSDALVDLPANSQSLRLGIGVCSNKFILECGQTLPNADCENACPNLKQFGSKGNHVDSCDSLASNKDLQKVVDFLCAWEMKQHGANREVHIPPSKHIAHRAGARATPVPNEASDSDGANKQHEELQALDVRKAEQDQAKASSAEKEKCDFQRDADSHSHDWRSAIWSEWQRTSFGGKQRSLWQCSDPQQEEPFLAKRSRLDSQ